MAKIKECLFLVFFSVKKKKQKTKNIVYRKICLITKNYLNQKTIKH